MPTSISFPPPTPLRVWNKYTADKNYDWQISVNDDDLLLITDHLSDPGWWEVLYLTPLMPYRSLSRMIGMCAQGGCGYADSSYIRDRICARPSQLLFPCVAR
mgnify:CR=1 FL=1